MGYNFISTSIYIKSTSEHRAHGIKFINIVRNWRKNLGKLGQQREPGEQRELGELEMRKNLENRENQEN